MKFLAAERLWLLLVVAGLVAAYLYLQSRRKQYAVRFTNLELLESVAPKRPGWRRHAPAGAMALALALLVVGLARPTRSERVPKEAATVMLVVDVSASMQATDVSPTRLQAAREAAVSFVGDLPERLRVGLVSFDRTTRVISPPTTDHESVKNGIQSLTTGPGTAAGDAILVALDAITASGGAGTTKGKQTAAIVLLSDGVTTVGTPVDEAAQAASEQGVPVTTIAFGTQDGTVDIGGRLIPVPADPASMESLAKATGGASFEAVSGKELKGVYAKIGTRVGYTTERREIGMRFVAVAVFLLVAAMGAALLWTTRIL
ncbi:MAG TPA: VWA domain-containing protein [Acidimicrobiales bacterium]|nr:VWA domain-containing protein [Acidimicrobiales bacterium]